MKNFISGSHVLNKKQKERWNTYIAREKVNNSIVPIPYPRKYRGVYQRKNQCFLDYRGTPNSSFHDLNNPKVHKNTKSIRENSITNRFC